MRRLLAILVGAALITAWHLAPLPADWVEGVFARGLYVQVTRLLVPAVDLAEISLTALLAPVLAGVALWWLASGWQSTPWRQLVVRKLLQAVTAVIGLYLLFLALWGGNYERKPVEALLQLDRHDVVEDDLEMLAEVLVGVIEATTPAPEERDLEVALDSIRRSLTELVAQTTGAAPSLNGRVKALPEGVALRFGSGGFVNPWLLEPHVEPALPEPFWLATAGHELAHIAGFAGEADADLVAALAGLQADEAFARYATALSLFVQIGAHLPSDKYQELAASLPAGATQEIGELREAVERYRSPLLTDLTRLAYDRFLRLQGVEAGIADYGRTVTLLVRAKRAGLAF